MKKLILLIILIAVPMLYSQVVYEPLYRDVYVFLDRMSQKGIIDPDDIIKPLPRIYIAGQLKIINEKLQKAKIKLTNLEKEELEFYIKDYSIELHSFLPAPKENPDSTDSGAMGHQSSITNQSSINNRQSTILLGFDQASRWRLFSYSDNLFKINVNPILGYETGKRDGEKNAHSWNGIGFYGYLKDYIGFSFDFRDNSESGKTIDKKKLFSNQTGVIVARSEGDKIEYSEARASISVDWSWGSVSAAKDFLSWGYGESGKLVLSQKAPSFPFIRLDIKPVSWLSFNYFHAWLSSDVVDSNEIYRTNSSLAIYKNRIIYRDKFLASHTLNIFPVKGLTLSLGESVVYSDKLQFAYLFPLMFFRSADHYLSKADNSAGSNSQFFFSVSSRNHLKNTHLYGTLFIDEVTLSGLFDSQKQRNQLGFTLGGSVTDLPVDNLSLTCEYTKIYPFVYSHYIPAQTYESSSYLLGHWMGNNADMIYGSVNYRFTRGLQSTLWGEYIRKGERGLVDQQYKQPQPPFLFGLKTNYLYSGLEIKYEILHDLFIRGQFQYTETSRDQASGNLLKDNFSEFHFALYYGL